MSPENMANYPSEPIRPGEVLAIKTETFPEEVFIAVNGLITERLSGQYASFTIKALKKRMEDLGLDRDEINERRWDQVGSVYQELGWDVSLHSPSMDDYDFDPYYYFATNGPRIW